MKKFRKLFFILLALLICGGVTVSVVVNNIRLNNTPLDIARRDKLKMIEPFLEDIGEDNYIVLSSQYDGKDISHYDHKSGWQDVYLQLKQDQNLILEFFKRSDALAVNSVFRSETGINFVFPNGEILKYMHGFFWFGMNMYIIQDNDREDFDNFVNNIGLNNIPSQINKLKMIEPFLEDIGDHSYIVIKPNFTDMYENIDKLNYNHEDYKQDVYLQLKNDQKFILGFFKKSIAVKTMSSLMGSIDFVFPNGEILRYKNGCFYDVEGHSMYFLQDHDRENLDNFVNNLILLDDNSDD